MNRMVGDVMVAPVVSVQPATSFKQTVRLLQEHRVSALPVIDRDGRLLGVITRRDLLRVFLRPDGDILHEITAGVLRGTFNLPGDAVQVEVRDGVVALAGLVPWRSGARELVDRVGAMDGVVEVVDRLSWRHDTMRAVTLPWG